MGGCDADGPSAHRQPAGHLTRSHEDHGGSLLERGARPQGKEERKASAEHKGTLFPLGWKVDSAENRMMREAVTCAFAFWPPLRSSPRSPSVGRALPRAGVLNAESRRNAEVPWDASRHAAGRADHANHLILPPGKPPSPAMPRGCLRVPDNLRVPSSAPKGRNPEAA